MSGFSIRQLEQGDGSSLESVNALFAEVFEDSDSYASARPDRAYLERLLSLPHFVALAAERDGAVIGALVGYELEKFEQARSEFYIYDLGVAKWHRRKGVATALIEACVLIAGKRGAHVVFVQADYEDPPAIALYEKLGRRAEVLHFDIAVTPPPR
ncbi:MAG: AAC(3)-I family aminoglycoside 3-N-acetyltransferase [Novosphingobium sp. 28-62-57]|uniref:AAC(3)-I family aminoglycoside N-acetyltransferase n=1 Tax=unclassified Novosphingobium TaxID=2644732 RepID=UPI000BD0CF26|nr:MULTISPECIES: AAC(3)-I family aminoglycoside N-acetyltransferase [unclassified Novosphingobium]OYW48531.1 MAG: AAC(3)-I family aminoglycoside 3-N-acetyltransferase [Novosphingobium sp. 12-62-10]OYZ08467.1 MAG: AAC(3)-I family aminoglycoside 3-N-acetyltransferase [Novosphingobium sp. 28-62-57]OZA36413.1 MAG: AAC(3)-I family aminoglycoside 3-N-acetyltransferase [Novosphingobium sp. 17-62-9]